VRVREALLVDGILRHVHAHRNSLALRASPAAPQRPPKDQVLRGGGRSDPEARERVDELRAVGVAVNLQRRSSLRQ
jgi:hypothetical protein